MLEFLNPYMPWVLALLALPFLILLIRRRRQVLRWAAFEWMKRAHAKRRKVSKVEQILKLIAKLALLLALALMVSRPVWRSSDARYLLIVDVTPSMGTTLGGGNRLAQASETVAAFGSALGADFGVATYDGELTLLAESAGSMMPTRWQEDIALSPQSAGLTGLADALQTAEWADSYDTVIFFSDFSDALYGEVDSMRQSLRRIGERRRITFVPVDSRVQLMNAGIESVTLPPEGYFTRAENRLQVRIRNFGPTPVDHVPVSLIVDGDIVDQAEASLAVGEALTLRFRLPAPGENAVEAMVSLAPDDFPLDDQFHFMLEPARPLRVLVGRRARGDAPFELDVFFRAALASIEAGDVTSVGLSQFAATSLRGYDLVATFGVPVTEGIAQSLTTYLAEGGAYMGFADLSSPDAWRALGMPSGSVSSTAVHPDIERGGLLDFMAQENLDPSRIHFFRYATFSDAAATGVLYGRDVEQPLSALFEQGEGRAILSNWMPAPGYTDFFYNPNFVQWTMRAISAILKRSPIVARGPADMARIVVQERDASASYQLTAEDSASQAMGAEREGDQIVLSASPPAQSGLYTVLKDGAGVLRFGYNLGTVDSYIEPVAPAILKPLEDEGLLRWAEPDRPERLSAVREFPWLFALLLLLAAGLEFYAHFLYARRAAS